jgi:hypothetical protein
MITLENVKGENYAIKRQKIVMLIKEVTIEKSDQVTDKSN